jgi:S1-C subfamily serine protease
MRWPGAALVGLLTLLASAALGLRAAPQPGQTGAVVVSASAQRIYENARAQLFQIRTLLKDQDSQASVGSGFLVSRNGHIVTNYHVVSQAALQPERYRLVYTTADGEEGALHLLAFDAIRDLALVTPADPAPLAGRTPLRFRLQASALGQGERIFSLGHPLDIGFAVIEGTYNGLVERSFYPTIFFAGSLNPGVSGGPTLDRHGDVVGVNVAARRDGEQVSFLVPAEFAADLLERGRTATPFAATAYAELTNQLTAHQDAMTGRFLAQPWRSARHQRYRLPRPAEAFMRCWGDSSPADARGLQYEESSCHMETRLFVSDWLTTGWLQVRHDIYDGRTLGPLRFANKYSARFADELIGGTPDAHRTAPQCHERDVDRDGLPLRAVFCATAYRKLPGLYDVTLLVATVNAATLGVQARLDAHGVSFDNALRLSAHYLDGLGLHPAPEGVP